MNRARSDRRPPARPTGVVLAAVGTFAVVAATAYALEALALRSARNGVTFDMRPVAWRPEPKAYSRMNRSTAPASRRSVVSASPWRR